MTMGNLLRLLRRRRRSDADFAREIAAHLALEAERLVALGMAPEEAAYAARRRFGNVTLAREDYHRRRTIGWLEAIPQQVRRACRRLVRAKAFSLTAAAPPARCSAWSTACCSDRSRSSGRSNWWICRTRWSCRASAGWISPTPPISTIAEPATSSPPSGRTGARRSILAAGGPGG